MKIKMDVMEIKLEDNMKIIYCSNTGFTKQYAIMLANKLGIESIDVKDIKKYDINI